MNCRSSVKLQVLFFFSILFVKERIDAFRCDNGKTIQDVYFCDGEPDCTDGSDEAFGCKPNHCGRGYFSCSDVLECKNMSVRCDRVNDCFDGSDEWNCVQYSKELTPEHCPLSDGKYLCRDRSKCLDLDKMCDEQCNCLDCSDEDYVKCHNYNDSCRLCPHHCLLTPYGAECVCSSSMNEWRPNALCERLVDCTTEPDHVCEQHCTNYDSKITWCSCNENSVPVPGTNGRECRTNVWFEHLLLYSTVSKIKVLNLTSQQVNVIKTDEFNLTALTAARNYTYYATFQAGKAAIFKITDTSEETYKVIETDSLITSLSVDWITENIYYINKGCIFVCTNNGDICIRLECSDVNYVVLAPTFGLMYYTKETTSQDVHQKIILKSNMDGSEKTVFIDEIFDHDISISIDEIRETLYWFEMKTQILYSISFYGSNRKQHNDFHQQLMERNERFTLSFAVFDKACFFLKSDYRSNTLFRFGSPLRTDYTTNAITHLYAYNPFLQNIIKLANPCATASCNGLCLLHPSSTTNDSNYTCLSQHHTYTNGSSWSSHPSTKPITDFELIPKTEITSITEKFFALTTKKEIETTTKQFRNSSPKSHKPYQSTADQSSSSILTTTTKPLHNITTIVTEPESPKSTNESFNSSAAALAQTSNTNEFLPGFILGAAIVSGIVGLYAIFRRFYWDRHHQQMSISELMNLQ